MASRPLPLVALDRVNVHLRGHRALTDISWQLQRGEHWAFVGGNGSGKSTLLRVIRGDQWIDPDGGERVYGFDGTPRTAMSAQANIGFVSPEQQEKYARLELPIDGRNVIASGFDDTMYVHGALSPKREAAVDAIIERLDLGPIVSRRARALSFGQLRRLLIARALVRRPHVLVLDEFTNGLDARSRAEILELLESLAGDVQMIFASHRFDDFIPAVTHHAMMKSGRMTDAQPGRPHPPLRAERLLAEATPAAFAATAPPMIEIRHAEVFRGKTHVLHDCTWSIAEGEHTALCGPNGSGKSTFAQLVAGTLSPVFGGDVVRDGVSGPFDIWKIKERVAHVSEEWQIAYNVNHTVEEVVISGFVDSVGLFHTPDMTQWTRTRELIGALGLDALRERPFMQLSFGERRKVLIARSLVRPPRLFILDEVWNGLDGAFRALLETQLIALAETGTTLLLIAHHDDDLPALIVRRFAIDGGRLRQTR